MKKTILLSTLLLIGLMASCGAIVKSMVRFKNPKVESRADLHQYFTRIFPGETTYYLSVEKKNDSAAIYENLLRGFASEMKIFDRQGTRYCYKGTEECSGVQLTNAFKNFEANYSPCADALSLDAFLKNFTTATGESVTKSDLPDAKYIVFQSWNKYSSSEKALKEDVAWVKSLRDAGASDVAVVFFNGDLQEEWGLEKGKELPVKFRKEKEGYSMEFGRLPRSGKNNTAIE